MQQGEEEGEGSSVDSGCLHEVVEISFSREPEGGLVSFSSRPWGERRAPHSLLG